MGIIRFSETAVSVFNVYRLPSYPHRVRTYIRAAFIHLSAARRSLTPATSHHTGTDVIHGCTRYVE